MAPIRAKLKVSAIGRNILPSTPLSERIGIKTIRMINWPKTAEFMSLEAPSRVILSLSFCRSADSRETRSARRVLIWKAINSTMITAPSMMIPKSMAPRLIRLASTPKIYIMERAKSRLNGITDATTIPERKFPSSRTTTKITIRHPRTRFSVMVRVVRPISSLRSRKAFI